jgi:class 3 adenylate cyclase
MTAGEIIGIVTGVLAIGGAIVAVTRYLTEAQTSRRIQTLEAEKREAEKARSDLAASHTLLREELAAARRAGGVASAKKGQVDDELRSLMSAADAEAGSVYVPFREGASDEVTALVFLALQPVTEQTLKLRRRPTPLRSLAGQAFRRGQGMAVADARAADEYYDRADQVSGYRTKTTLSLPLEYRGDRVGVLQLLNRRSGGPFVDADVERFSRDAAPLARLVHEFLQLPGGLELLGVATDRESENATIMFCDLTASARLFQELNLASAVQHINEYLELVCQVAFRHGATVDKYLGDGALLRFNVPQRVDDHAHAAVTSALEIRQQFSELKHEWTTLGNAFDGIYTRAGLAYGPVRKAMVGHPQYQYLTLFGTALNAAVNLCDAAPRDRSIVVIDQQLRTQLGDRITARPLGPAALGKAASYTDQAFEVIAPR